MSLLWNNKERQPWKQRDNNFRYLLLFSLFISVMGLHSESICTSLHRQHLCKGIYYVDKGAKR